LPAHDQKDTRWIDPHSPLLEYNAQMRRRMVIALAVLTISLTGGSCEFRAASNNPIPGDPPPEGGAIDQKTGLLVDVRVGGSDSGAGTAAIQSPMIATALATSVLSAPSRTPAPSVDSAMPVSRSEQILGVSTVQAASAPIANPIPEPSGIWLFGLGSICLAWRFRNPR
jgi:hypothetical protein